MNSKNQQKKKEIDWMITLVPLALIVALCIVFFFAPEQSNQVLGQIRFLFGDTFGTYYLVDQIINNWLHFTKRLLVKFHRAYKSNDRLLDLHLLHQNIYKFCLQVPALY